MSRNRKKKWIDIEREESGERRRHRRAEHRMDPEYYGGEGVSEEEYYDGYDAYTGDAASEEEYYGEYGEEGISEEGYYGGYGEDAASEEGYYGGYGEEGVSEEGYYGGYGEEGASEEEYYGEYGEEGASEEEYYGEYGEEGASEEEYYDGYGEEGASEEGYYSEYGEDAVPEEAEYYEEYAGDSVSAEDEYYDGYAASGEERAYYGENRPERRRRWLLPVLCALFLAGVAGGFLYGGLPHYFVKEELTIEAGAGCPAAADFLKHGSAENAVLSGVSEDTVFEHVEDIPVTVHVYLWDVPVVLHVADTVAPELVTKDKTVMLGESFEAEDFVESVSDATACKLSLEKPEITAGGIYTVALTAEDEAGNRTEREAQLEVIEDTTAPVIEGVQELTAGVGKTVSYKRGVTVTDDHDEDVALEIDNSRVDLGTPGDYEVVYSAVDKAGNKTEISTVVHVIEEPMVEEGGEEVVVTEEMVNAQADKILAEITDPSMSQYEIIQAIYNWCNKKIAYLDGVPKTNWVMGAYEGLIERRGDCFTFAMSSKCLLNRAGIKNMDIERVRVGDSMHFWNLVDIGEGWHHFDTCRRGDGATFFYLTDAELMAYSEAHISAKYPNGTHYYDRSLYPEIP